MRASAASVSAVSPNPPGNASARQRPQLLGDHLLLQRVARAAAAQRDDEKRQLARDDGVRPEQHVQLRAPRGLSLHDAVEVAIPRSRHERIRGAGRRGRVRRTRPPGARGGGGRARRRRRVSLVDVARFFHLRDALRRRAVLHRWCRESGRPGFGTRGFFICDVARNVLRDPARILDIDRYGRRRGLPAAARAIRRRFFRAGRRVEQESQTLLFVRGRLACGSPRRGGVPI